MTKLMELRNRGRIPGALRRSRKVQEVDYGLDADNLPWLTDLCEMWGTAEADTVENEPVRVDAPTLILAGEFDPVPPPSSRSEPPST